MKTKNKKNKYKIKSYSSLLLGIWYLFIVVFFIILYFYNVNTTEWLNKDNYNNNQEWFIQISIFLSLYASLVYFLNNGIDWINDSIIKNENKLH